MLTFLSNAFSKKAKRTHPKQATRRGRSTRLGVESLETRQMMSVTAFNDFGVLVVNADSLDNNIRIERLNFGDTGAFRVFADGRYVSIEVGGSYQPSLNAIDVEVHGNGGNDTIWTDSLAGFGGNVFMYGGAGNDLLSMAHATSYGDSMLFGGSGRDILVGGLEEDYLYGSTGQDVLIGGAGHDFLSGGDHEDLLIAGYTDFDRDMPALRQIRSFWTSTRTYTQRVDGLLHGTNIYALNESTVHTDNNWDEVWGDAGLDRFYTHYGQDDAMDNGTGERITNIRWWF